jgi:hypothetical protein
MLALIEPRLLHINLVCAIFYFFKYNTASKLRAVNVGSLHSHDCFFVLMAGDVSSYGARRVTDALRYSRVRELAAVDDQSANRANMLGRSNAQAPCAVV